MAGQSGQSAGLCISLCSTSHGPWQEILSVDSLPCLEAALPLSIEHIYEINTAAINYWFIL